MPLACSDVVRWVKSFIPAQLQGGLITLAGENTCKNRNSHVVALTQLPHFKDVLEAISSVGEQPLYLTQEQLGPYRCLPLLPQKLAHLPPSHASPWMILPP